MITVLFVSLSLTSVISLQNCSNLCWFAFNNPSGPYTRGEENKITIPSKHKVTGIVTISGEYFSPRDYQGRKYDLMRFIIKGNELQPLVFNVQDDGDLRVYGIKNYQNKIYGKKATNYNFKDSKIHIQISAIHNKMYVGKPGNASLLDYNNTAANLSELNRVTLITYDQFVSVYKFISICEHPKPILCDTKSSETTKILVPTETINVGLGMDLEISCTGSGAPYLQVEWVQNTYKNITLELTETYNQSTADHAIRSTLKLTQFSVDNIGTFTCKSSNKNFKYSVSKVFTFNYSSKATFVLKPTVDYYTANQTLNSVL